MHRPHFEHRAAIIATERDELLSDLHALSRGEPSPTITEGTAKKPGKTAFCFSGQGSQWPGMGEGLYESFPVFTESIDATCAELDDRVGRALKGILFSAAGSKEESLLHETQFTQAALFVIEVALYRLVSSLGITPDYLIGHSIGEAGSRARRRRTVPAGCLHLGGGAWALDGLCPGGGRNGGAGRFRG